MEITAYILLGVALTLIAAYLANRFMSFTAQTPNDYAGWGPDFDIRTHLRGPILCEGVIYGPTGRVTSRFTADFDARWEGDKGVLTEVFTYDSGARRSRVWYLEVDANGAITAEAPDVVGKGRGTQKGAGVQLTYDIRLPEESGGHVLRATDWMYLVGDGVIINRSQFRKYGIKVAELVATMRPREAETSVGSKRDAA
ncbi:MAG: DUF3833 family protein [Pseudomonadota bacterium]